ncbi:type II toxin-antitoxin system toxin ribonuclease C26 [soil metagenome]
MNNHSLIDTGFIFAVLDDADERHTVCAEAYKFERNTLLPEVVLPELAYLMLRENKTKGLIKFLRYISDGNLPIISAESQDLKRASEILEKYADSKFDFVDCVIFAIAERLEIKRILTVDRRHFNIFRPKHCDAFEIIP